MLPVKTPTSSLSAVELIANKIWHRSKMIPKVPKLVWKGRRATPSPFAGLPYELVDAIISNLIYDIDALRACSRTCFSLYIATLPYLYYCLISEDCTYLPKGNRWPRPLHRYHKLGLLPFVKQLCIRYTKTFTPEKFERQTLNYFSALTNLQELGIDGLQVSSFVPNAQKYFGHLAPTLQFLALKEPKGSCREILYFIGLFPRLQDLKLCSSHTKEEENTADLALVPLSVPPLCGRLTLSCFGREKLLKEMIKHFGGLRFCYMDLYEVKCARLVLAACAETLKTLRLYSNDKCGNRDVGSHFDLSKNKSLQTLETTAVSITLAGDAASDFFKIVLSTIKTPQPLSLIVDHRENDFGCGELERGKWSYYRYCRERKQRINYELSEKFRVLHEMCSVQKLQLVLCMDVHPSNEKFVREVLDHFLEDEKSGMKDFLLGMSIISTGRWPSLVRCQGAGGHMHQGAFPISYSAL